MESDSKAAADTDFFDELRHVTGASSQQPESPPPLREAPPRVLAVRGGYMPAESNVYQLDSVRPNHGVWHGHEPSRYAGMEPRRHRPRNARRPKPAAVKKRYRSGRFIVALFALMGWLLAAGGLAASLVAILEPDLSVRLGSPNLFGSAGALAGGLLTVALAAATRAVFDFANDQREMLVMHQQRARFGGELY